MSFGTYRSINGSRLLTRTDLLTYTLLLQMHIYPRPITMCQFFRELSPTLKHPFSLTKPQVLPDPIHDELKMNLQIITFVRSRLPVCAAVARMCDANVTCS